MLFQKEDIGVKTNNQDEAGKDCSAFTSKFLNVQSYMVNNLPEDLKRLPDPGEIFFLQTMSSFNAFTFVELISRLQFIEELYATTYSVSLSVLEALQEMQASGRIGRIKLLISDSMRSRNPRICDALNAWAETDGNVTIIYTWNHSKITLAKTEFGDFCIEGSGNWSKNAQYEQYIFTNNEDVMKLRKQLFYDCKVVHRIN
ncbi:hypothetical protein [Chryseobacterium sp. MP_3.2]|uniref:hypothetical protein n=1 Tax=Chryseobacterium sp. MP_3.2 TaxID=3071712 RepID=UPI002DFB1746|nr:hypothetical protein [Chryseobacterium sp. MP_3.2]